MQEERKTLTLDQHPSSGKAEGGPAAAAASGGGGGGIPAAGNQLAERKREDDGSGSPNWISAADDPQGSRDGEEAGDFGSDSGSEFEFAVQLDDGHIHPVYPVFNRDLLGGGDEWKPIGGDEEDDKVVRAPLRRLLIAEREACPRSDSTSSSSSVEDLEGVPPESYCIWAPRSMPPSPGQTKKSSSTGSSMRWRLRNLVVGRSHSDGKDRFVFLSPSEEKPPKEPSPEAAVAAAAVAAAAAAAAEEEKKGKGKGKAKKATELDMVTAHRLLYRKPSGNGSATGRRSFLPYKVGFLASPNGSSRSHHPS